MIENPELRRRYPPHVSQTVPARPQEPQQPGEPEEALETVEDDQQESAELPEGLRRTLDEIPEAQLLKCVDYLHGRASAALEREIGAEENGDGDE